MEYKVVQSRNGSGEWRVEAIDHESDGECYVAIFCGPKAQQWAEEYAVWKNAEVAAIVG